MINDKLPKIWYGGDYNPEQWDAETWKEDHRMFKLAGIDVVTLNVFAWALSQPNEDTYDFAWLDEQMNLMQEQGIGVCLATSTAAHPAWMARKYPDVLRVDRAGRKRKFGGRHNSCPNSPTYRKYAQRMATKLAERYANHPALLIWHISNEYGGYCYCDNCAESFRLWLQKRYASLDVLNRAWYTRFWGHTFYDWEEIVPPNELSEEGSPNHTKFQGISLDYRRFQSESMLSCYQLEYHAVKALTPDVPVTTNLMGLYPELDYFKWAPHLDVISWDNYPGHDTPVSLTAMTHDLMRGLKSGQPWMLMEQTPSQQNWQPYNSLKRPGVMRLWSYQAIARGADTIMFFQLRRSIGACEKYHGAVIEHVGHEHTRIFQECAQLGEELKQLGDILVDARNKASIAIVYDWENRWAIELSSGPTVDLNYAEEVHRYYDALFKLNIAADLVSVEEDFSTYDVVVAPVMYMTKPGYAEKVEAYVSGGGTYVTTFFSGIVDERDIVITGGYPGKLRKVLGIWAEEIDALPPDMRNRIVVNEESARSSQPEKLKNMREGGITTQLTGEYDCGLLCDLIHTETAEVVAVYGRDFYAGMPALTVNRFGQGNAWYVATRGEEAFLTDFLGSLCREMGISPLVAGSNAGIETAARGKNGETFLFLLNHNAGEATADIGKQSGTDLLTGREVSGAISIPGRDLMIVRLQR